MTFDEFRDNWMRPGFSEKAGRRTATANPAASTARQRMDARLPIGEKGIGRLAAGRLGDTLDVYTRKHRTDSWLHIPFDWNEFDDMNILLDEVEIRGDYNSEPPAIASATGTTIEIGQLTLNWAGRVPGRRIAGRSTSRFGRLRQDLELLISPLQATQQAFVIELRSDLPEHEEFRGVVASADLRLIDYRYDFEITWDDHRGVRVHFEIRRAADFARELDVRAHTSKTEYYPAGAEVDADDPTMHPGSLQAGPISGTLFYAARKGTGRRLEELGIQPGVRIYRDGARVEPYGDADDDWLGVQARKASRQGYAAIRPNHLYGFVLISKISNQDLIDMTNRQGLVQNQAYDEFVTHMRAEFRRFADVVFEEFVQPDWKKDEERAQELAVRTATDRDVVVRDIVHSLRQPVASLGTEMRSLDYVIDNSSIPEGPKGQLREILDRANRHLADIAEVVRIALEEPISSEIESVSISEVVEQAVDEVRNLAAASGVEVRRDLDEKVVLARRMHFRRALAELLRNAIQAPRPEPGTVPVVAVTSTSRDGTVVIRVTDNGTGVDGAISANLFETPVSTKGRQGEGLILVRNLLATFSAEVRLTNPGEPGAAFEIIVPSMGEIRRILR
jgi:signal transduction histidine kinase